MIKIHKCIECSTCQLAFVEERRTRGFTFLDEIQESDNEQTMAENGNETSETSEKGN